MVVVVPLLWVVGDLGVAEESALFFDLRLGRFPVARVQAVLSK